MVLNPQQLLQWQMWVNDEAQQLMIDQQSHGNPANLTYDTLTGTRAMADMIAQLANITLRCCISLKKLPAGHKQRLIALTLMVHLLRLFKDMRRNILNL